MNASEYIVSRERQRFRDGIVSGLVLGLISAILVLGAVGLGLDRWRVRNDSRLRAEAVAAVEAKLGKCASDLRHYQDVVALADQIDAARAR